MMSQASEVKDRNIEKMTKLFKDTLETRSAIYNNIFFCDLNGDIIVSAKSMGSLINAKDRKYFIDAIQTGQFATSEYTVGRATNLPLFQFSYPVMNYQDTIIGVLVMSVNLNSLGSLFDKIQLPEGAFIRLLDHNGISLLRIPEEERHYPTGSKLRADFLKLITTTSPEGTFIRTGSDGIEKLYCHVSIAVENETKPYMYIIMGIPTKTIYRETNTLLFASLGVTALSLAASIISFQYFSRRSITDRIELLSELMQRNITEPLPPLVDRHNDELSKFLECFTAMRKRILSNAQILEKEKEKAEAANIAKSRFLATMSHEIRTPFNGIMSMLQLCQTTELQPEQQDYIANALASSRKLLNLVNDILDLAKIEQGKSIVCLTPFPLKRLLGDIECLFTPQLQAKHLAFHGDIDDTIPAMVSSDEGKVRQILFNLVGNAVKFTDSGAIRVTVYNLEPASVTNRFRSLFIVSDTGCGIADEDIPLLFLPFTQIEGSYTQQYKGAGLGLSIVKNLVHILNGSLCIDSQRGSGTAVYFTLELYAAPEDRKRDRPPAALPAAPSPTVNLRILLAEDERINQIGVRAFVEKMGHRIDIANNGHEVLEHLEKQTYDLILMDIQMPELDGLTTTRMIRSSDKAHATIPIIALTAYAMQGDREAILAAGLNDYMTKPLEFDVLQALIVRHATRAV